MREAGIRVQGTGISWQRCGVSGCRNLAALSESYCGECAGEIAYLRQWHRLRDERESRWAMVFFTVCSTGRRLLWIPLTVLVIAAMVALGAAWAPSVCEWMVDGGLLP